LWLLQINPQTGAVADRPDPPGVFLEFRLKDEAGNVQATVTLPDSAANPWIRYRQQLLIQPLAEDQPIQPMAGEVIPPAGQTAQTTTIWDFGSGKTLHLTPVPEHLVPRDRPVFGPTDLSLALTRSYARYLCRTRQAASAQVIRHTREPVPPPGSASEGPTPGATDDLIADFGDLSR
jgi:hypothetical protein